MRELDDIEMNDLQWHVDARCRLMTQMIEAGDPEGALYSVLLKHYWNLRDAGLGPREAFDRSLGLSPEAVHEELRHLTPTGRELLDIWLTMRQRRDFPLLEPWQIEELKKLLLWASGSAAWTAMARCFDTLIGFMTPHQTFLEYLVGSDSQLQRELAMLREMAEWESKQRG